MGFVRRHWQWFLGAGIALAWWRLSADPNTTMIQVPPGSSAKDNQRLAGF